MECLRGVAASHPSRETVSKVQKQKISNCVGRRVMPRKASASCWHLIINELYTIILLNVLFLWVPCTLCLTRITFATLSPYTELVNSLHKELRCGSRLERTSLTTLSLRRLHSNVVLSKKERALRVCKHTTKFYSITIFTFILIIARA